MWQELLGIEGIGIDDDFFEMGGHSLLATQVVARLRTIMAMEELLLESIFEAPTVRQLAVFVGNQKTTAEADQAALFTQQIKQMTPEQREQMVTRARGAKA